MFFQLKVFFCFRIYNTPMFRKTKKKFIDFRVFIVQGSKPDDFLPKM